MIRDDVLGLALRDQIAYEIRHHGVLDTACHVTVCLSDGRVIQRADGRITPGFARREWARMTCERMNRLQGGVRHGGAWVIVWCEPVNQIDRTPTRLMFLWKDQDGDVPLMFDGPESFEDAVMWGPDWPLAHATEAVKRYWERQKNLGIKPDEYIRAAQGERAYDPKTGRPVDAGRIVIDPFAAVD